MKWVKLTNLLTHFFPMFLFHPSENIGKPKVFWCFQGDRKEILEREGLSNASFSGHCFCFQGQVSIDSNISSSDETLRHTFFFYITLITFAVLKTLNNIVSLSTLTFNQKLTKFLAKSWANGIWYDSFIKGTLMQIWKSPCMLLFV